MAVRLLMATSWLPPPYSSVSFRLSAPSRDRSCLEWLAANEAGTVRWTVAWVCLCLSLCMCVNGHCDSRLQLDRRPPPTLPPPKGSRASPLSFLPSPLTETFLRFWALFSMFSRWALFCLPVPVSQHNPDFLFILSPCVQVFGCMCVCLCWGSVGVIRSGKCKQMSQYKHT